MVLDEPTNDLDLPTLSVLENFLMDYQGCLIIISHDRYFMDRIVDHLFVFEGNGIIKDFPGNYAEYREEQEKKESATPTKAKVISQVPEAAPISATNTTVKKKPSFNEKREFEVLEKEMIKLNEEKDAITHKLNNETLDYTAIEQLSSRFKAINDELDNKELRWLELSELFE